MRVVIVGAGLAGLTAASDLASRGIEVLVLEAQGRVGGRTKSIGIDARTCVDAGAAYLGKRHTELLSLIARLGLSTTATTMAGDSVFALRAQPSRSQGRFPPLRATALGEMFELLHALCTSVQAEAPWLGESACDHDASTAAQWAQAFLSHPDARLFFPLFLAEMMAADPADVSVLHMGFYLRSGGGLSYLNAFEGGAQEARISEGAHEVCRRMADSLGPRVRLARPVRAVHQRADSVVVHTEHDRVPAEAAIIAVPPRLAAGIDFQPALAAPRATGATAPGCAVKVHLVYPEPLWRRHGLSGWSLSAQGPLLSTVDDSPADGSAGVLTGFVTGSEARRFGRLAPHAQRDAAREHVRGLFPQLPEPSACHVTDWLQEPYAKGCYAALFGPGDWMRLGPHLTRPHGRIHWAGTETSTSFFGLMEGAVRSGIRAAAEVAARL